MIEFNYHNKGENIMYEFLNSTNANDYEDFVKAHKNGSFMQSLKWANVKTNWESEAIVSRGEHGEIRGTCLVLIKKLPFCSMLYAPRGPVCDYSNKETLADIAEGIDVLAKRYHAFAVICDPPIFDDKELQGIGFSRKVADEKCLIQCSFNYILNLNGKTLDEIREGFKPEYRNRIGKAQRHGVWCEELCSESAINALDDFYKLMIQTGKRDEFPIRSKEYFVRFLRALGKEARLFMCYANIGGFKTPLSGAITVNYGGKFSYVYGASSDFWRNFYPNYLMQWAMINAAHDSGCRVYDFGGVPYYYDKNRREYGMYKFKKGFGGEVAAYAGQFVKSYRPILERAAVIFSAVLR